MRTAQFVLACFLALTASGEPLNVKFKVRGYFMAASTIKDPKALGGYASSLNTPKRLHRPVPPDHVSLLAYPSEPASFGKNSGFLVILANTTHSPAAFAAQDSRINIVREALDADGKWKPIEYLPNSWCGNSYHTVFLPPDRYWSFSAPQYSGPFKTKMRFVLEQEGLKLVSNEFDGSINREQFTKKQGHTATNIMDPYDE